jgi:hypothetical protein
LHGRPFMYKYCRSALLRPFPHTGFDMKPTTFMPFLKRYTMNDRSKACCISISPWRSYLLVTVTALFAGSRGCVI